MMRWPLTLYVDSLPQGRAGCANGPVIRILKAKRDDEGLYQHELMHVKQWFLTLGLHSLLYLLVDEYKLWAEVAAYRKQATYYADDRRPLFAGFIAHHYDLRITPESALALLRE